MLRFLIVLPVYVVVASLLPRWPAVQPLLDMLVRVPTPLSVQIAAGALIVAVSGLFLLGRLREKRQLAAGHPVAAIVRMGLIGLVFAAAFDLLTALNGQAVTPVGLVLVSTAFLVAEAVYQTVLWIRGQARKQPADHDASTGPPADGSDEDTHRLRLLITVPVYIFVLVFLPELDAYQQLVEPLSRVDPPIVALISGLAVIAGGAVLYIISRRQNAGQSITRPFLTALTASAAAGLVFAGILNSFGYVVRYRPSLSDLIVLPVGFAAAEMIYLGIRWRLARGPVEL